MTRIDDFAANIARSGLIRPRELAQARAQIAPEPEADGDVRLARFLVSQGALTSYQARKVLSGATRGFFLGGYRILRPLGEGGMGKVFLAARDRDGLKVAIKVLPPARALQDEGALIRFRREMELSQRVQHPNLARTLEVGRDADTYFMVMEYIPGKSLYDLVKGPTAGPLRVADTARLFVKVLDGLAAAHNAGLVHRDLKPSNIMVTPEGDARILDLGLARAFEGEAEGDEPLGQGENVVTGTLDYASPEQLGNVAAADRRSDLYSIGCTLYFTLAGRPPFEGGDAVNKIFKHRMDHAESLEDVTRGVPGAFAAIVRKLMAKKPADRYQTCEELRAELARWTDPDRVHAILGAEAEAARAFRPPVPTLEEDDLQMIGQGQEDGSSPVSFSLRDLGAADHAPSRPAPPPPPRRITRSPEPPKPPEPPPEEFAAAPLQRRRYSRLPLIFSPPSSSSDDRWLLQFIVIALFLGVLAILAITLLR